MALKMTHDQRMRQHNHNGHHGRVRFSYQAMKAIAESSSVTPPTKFHAQQAMRSILLVLENLKLRVNADGTVTAPKTKIVAR